MGYLLKIISILSFGFSNVLWKLPSEQISTYKIIFLRSILTSSFFLIALVITGNSIDLSYNSLYAISISFFSFFGLYFYNKAIRLSTVSQTVTITTCTAIFGVITALIVYKEPFNYELIYAIGLISSGLFLLERQTLTPFNGLKRFPKWSKGTFFALISAFFWGTTFALFKIPIKKIGTLNFSLILESTVLITAFIFLVMTKQKFKPKEVSTKNIMYIICLGILGFLGVLFYNKSLNYLPVSVLAIMGSSTPLISIGISKIWLKESFNLKQYVGMAFIIGGNLLLIF